jgi:hypothetical protein
MRRIPHCRWISLMGMEAISWCERRRPFLVFLAASARCLQEVMEDLDEERE